MKNWWAIQLKNTKMKIASEDGNPIIVETGFQPLVLLPTRQDCLKAIKDNNSRIFETDAIISKIRPEVEVYRIVDRTTNVEEIVYIFPLIDLVFNKEDK